MRRPDEAPSPWYRHFWPWFIVVLMALSIAASLWTVVLAHRHRDVEVGDSGAGGVKEVVATRSGSRTGVARVEAG